jgi:hypothetical protein
MQIPKPAFKSGRAKRRPHTSAGYSLSETVIAVAAGAALITAGAAGLRTISSSMQHSSELSSLRANATSGMRMLRSEVQRSLFMIVRGGTHDSERDYTNLDNADHPEYASVIAQCKALKGSGSFNPMFGMKMAELNTPVIYGLGLAKNGLNYALIRCGPPLNADGRYETEDLILAPVLENIGTLPCMEPDGTCEPPKNQSGAPLTLNEIVDAVDTRLDSNNRSQIGRYLEPSIAIQTDPIRKMLKFVDPNEANDRISASYLQSTGNRSDAIVNLNLIAYARADKVMRTDSYYEVMNGDPDATNSPVSLSGCTGSTCSFYGIPVTSDSVLIIVDGSGSMSSCITWGTTKSSSYRTYFNGSTYRSTRRNCLVTRMESLQNELRNLLTSLPSTTTISLQAFSSPGYLNHRSWMNGNMMPLTDNNRSSALAFVNSLSSGDVSRWGGTSPWSTLDKAMGMTSAKSLYFMTDGDPNNDRNGGSWSTADFQPSASTYLSMNNSRTSRITINTVSIGQDSDWLKLISDGASGIYKMVNQAYTAVN